MALNVSKFLEQFFAEAAEKLTRIENFLIVLEGNPNDKEAISGIQRDMHTIKGSARMVGMSNISVLAHSMEDLFSHFFQGKLQFRPDQIDSFYAVLDVLKQTVSQRREITPRRLSAMEKLVSAVRDQGLTQDGPDKRPPDSQPPRRQFSVDFGSLKKKFSESRPEPVVPRDDLRESPGVTEPLPEPSGLPPRGKAPVPEKSAITSASVLAPEKSFLKVEVDRLDSVINLFTDLLSKKYFFSNVTQAFQKLARLAEGFQKEVQRVKGHLNASSPGSETIDNIERSFEIFHKNIFDFEKSFQINLNNFESGLKDIYDNLLDLKLTPIMSVFELYPRFVRDFSRKSQKKIRLYMRGGESQLDKTIIEKINEPLIHLIRNACDHGIELPQERRSAGKDESGTVILEANKKGNRIEIHVKDDGRGLQRDKIVARAVRSGLVEAEKSANLEDQEIYQFIFEPNFTTSEEISEISGRGIGMDVVKKAIQELGGTVAVQSTPGAGTSFTLEFPVAIFTNRVLMVREENRNYAFLSGLVRSIRRIEAGMIRIKSDTMQVVLEGELFTVAKLDQVILGRDFRLNKPYYFLLFPKSTDRKIALIVDDILYEEEVIIKDPGPFLGKLRFVSGLLIAKNGELQIVLDLYDIISSPEFSRKTRLLHSLGTDKSRKKRILVVDDSLLVREMEKNVLESNGFEVVTAINGLDGYNKAISDKFDLVLADIEMPEMDGFEMIENLKKIEEYRKKPIIVLSTRDREEDRIRGIKVGANAWLQKQNFNEGEFIKLVKSFLS